MCIYIYAAFQGSCDDFFLCYTFCACYEMDVASRGSMCCCPPSVDETMTGEVFCRSYFPSWYRSNTDVLGGLSFLIKFHCTMIRTTLSEKQDFHMEFPVVTNHVWSTNICGKLATSCSTEDQKAAEEQAKERLKEATGSAPEGHPGEVVSPHRTGIIKLPFFGWYQTMQIYGEFEGFPIKCSVWVGNIMTTARHVFTEEPLKQGRYIGIRSHFWNMCFFLICCTWDHQKGRGGEMCTNISIKSTIRHIWEMESLILQALKDQIAKFYCVYYTYMCRITVV